MLWKILGAIAGYTLYLFCVGVLFIGFSVAMGPDRLYRPDNYEPSMVWVVGALVCALIAAMIGGAVAVRIGKSGAVKILAGIVVVIGVMVFVGLLRENTPVKTRTADLPVTDSMFMAREPMWMTVINPLVVVAGVFAGGRLRRNNEL